MPQMRVTGTMGGEPLLSSGGSFSSDPGTAVGRLSIVDDPGTPTIVMLARPESMRNKGTVPQCNDLTFFGSEPTLYGE